MRPTPVPPPASRLVPLLALILCLPLTLAADEPAGPGSLLERLSSETAALVAHADARVARLTGAGGTWHGVLAGTPPRFVVALGGPSPEGGLPERGTLTLADGSVREATRADADAELGLAVYEVSGAAPPGFALATGTPLRRGSLAVVAGGEPALRGIEREPAALEDLSLGAAAPGAPALAPSGALLGLRAGSPLGCVACHVVDADVEGAQVLRWDLPGSRALLGNVGEWRSRSPHLVYLLGAQAQRAHADGLTRWLSDQGHGLTNGHERFQAAQAAAPEAPGGWVPAGVIERALADLSAKGAFARPYLGVVIDGPPLPLGQAATETWLLAVRQELTRVRAPGEGSWGQPARPVGPSLAREAGVRLSGVLPDSPAAKAGLEKGLRIVELDGRPVGDAAGFARALARRRPGETVRLSVDGWAGPAEVVLGDREKDARGLASADSVGLSVQRLTPELARFLGLPAEGQGLVVREVKAGSPAAAAGFQRGDLIVDGGGGPIRDEGELDAVLGAAKESALLGVQRGAERLALALTLPPSGVGRNAR